MEQRNFDRRLPDPKGDLAAMLATVPADALAPLAAFFYELAERITDATARAAFYAALAVQSQEQADRFARLVKGLADDPERHPPNELEPAAADYARRLAIARRKAVSRSRRDSLIWAMAKGGKSLDQIGRKVGLHPVSVSRIVSRQRRSAAQKQPGAGQQDQRPEGAQGTGP